MRVLFHRLGGGALGDFYQTNVLGTKYVLNACREAGIQAFGLGVPPSIYAASDQLAIKESAAPQENNLINYIRSKLASEKLFDYPDVPVLFYDLVGFLGLGIPVSCSNSVRRLAFPDGDGRQLMDMTCVENVALAIRLALRPSS